VSQSDQVTVISLTVPRTPEEVAEMAYMKRIAASPVLSRIYYSLGFIAFKICMAIPFEWSLFYKLLPYAGIYSHSESLKDWRDRCAEFELPTETMTYQEREKMLSDFAAALEKVRAA